MLKVKHYINQVYFDFNFLNNLLNLFLFIQIVIFILICYFGKLFDNYYIVTHIFF